MQKKRQRKRKVEKIKVETNPGILKSDIQEFQKRKYRGRKYQELTHNIFPISKRLHFTDSRTYNKSCMSEPIIVIFQNFRNKDKILKASGVGGEKRWSYMNDQQPKFKVSTRTLNTRIQWNNIIKILRVHFFHNRVLYLVKKKVDYRYFQTCKDFKIFTSFTHFLSKLSGYIATTIRVKKKNQTWDSTQERSVVNSQNYSSGKPQDDAYVPVQRATSLDQS